MSVPGDFEIPRLNIAPTTARGVHFFYRPPSLLRFMESCSVRPIAISIGSTCTIEIGGSGSWQISPIRNSADA